MPWRRNLPAARGERPNRAQVRRHRVSLALFLFLGLRFVRSMIHQINDFYLDPCTYDSLDPRGAFQASSSFPRRAVAGPQSFFVVGLQYRHAHDVMSSSVLPYLAPSHPHQFFQLFIVHSAPLCVNEPPTAAFLSTPLHCVVLSPLWWIDNTALLGTTGARSNTPPSRESPGRTAARHN